MASAPWGRNMAPYWLLDSPYSLVSVNMVLAAGNVTRTMPCTSPAALMTVRSAFEAIWPSRQLQPSGQSAGSYRPVPQSAGRAGRCHPPSREDDVSAEVADALFWCTDRPKRMEGAAQRISEEGGADVPATWAHAR